MKDYREKKSFNFVDVLIIVSIILIILGIIFRAQIIGIFYDTGSMSDFTVTFEAENVPIAVSERVQDGRHVRWTEKNLKLGKIYGIESSPSVVYTLSSDGSYVRSESETEVTITGTIRVEGTEKNGLHVNGTDFLAAGMEITVSTETAQFRCVITSVEKDD